MPRGANVHKAGRKKHQHQLQDFRAETLPEAPPMVNEVDQQYAYLMKNNLLDTLRARLFLELQKAVGNRKEQILLALKHMEEGRYGVCTRCQVEVLRSSRKFRNANLSPRPARFVSLCRLQSDPAEMLCDTHQTEEDAALFMGRSLAFA